jgi:putative transposase
MLGRTPAAAWIDSLARGVTQAIPADPDQFLLSFLPVTRRRLQRNGLHFQRIRYWSAILPAIAQPLEPLVVRYDPRDLSRLYVLGPDRHYHTVPYANLTHPPISLGELQHLYATLRARTKGRIAETQIFAVHERQRQIAAATLTTKTGRRSGESKLHRRTPRTSPANSIDDSKDPTPLPSEK